MAHLLKEGNSGFLPPPHPRLGLGKSYSKLAHYTPGSGHVVLINSFKDEPFFSLITFVEYTQLFSFLPLTGSGEYPADNHHPRPTLISQTQLL